MKQQPYIDAPGPRWNERRSPGEPDRGFEHHVLAMLETHGEREGAALAAYRDLATGSAVGDGVRYLITLILEDEERHHRVFAEMANAIRSFVWEVDVEPSVPTLAPARDAPLLEQTQRLLAFEKEDQRELKALKKVLKDSPKSSLQPLLVELMLHDTAKHIAILEHIRHRLR